MSSLGPSSGQGFSSPYSSGQTSRKSVEKTPQNQEEQSGSKIPVPSPNTPSQENTPQGQIPFDALFRSDLNMNSAQVARLLRQLLHLPPEILELLALLSELEPGNSSAILQKFSQEQANVLLDDLQSFLLDRLNSSQDKLIKLIQSDAGKSGSSLSVLLRLREELAEQTGHSSMDAIKTLITLYLPGLPLRDMQEFRLRFLNPNTSAEKQLEERVGEKVSCSKLSEEDEKTEGKEEGARWLITIRTYTWGEFRIVLIINAERSKPETLTAQIGHDVEAAAILPEIRSRLTLAMANENLPEPLLTFILKKNSIAAQGNSQVLSHPSQTENNSETPGQTDQIAHVQAGNASARVPAIGIHWAYRIIRLILDLDNQATTVGGLATE